MRSGRPYVFANLKSGHGVDAVIDFILTAGGIDAGATDVSRDPSEAA